MTTTTIGWILIITNILPVSSQECPTAARDGHMCHRRNVALNRTTTQSSNYTDSMRTYLSGYAVDGKTGHDLVNTPCTHTNNGPGQYWMVTLDKPYWIYRFTIYNRIGGCDDNKECGARLNNFTLSVGNSTGPYTTCYQDSTTSANGPGDIITQHCTSPVLGNTVKISLSSGTYLTLCEVLLYVCDDGWYGEMCERQCATTTACLRCDATGKRCAECVPGRYGEHCKNRCGNCYWNCAKQTGECFVVNGVRCQAGYEGYRCSDPCADGLWGADCPESCGNCYNENVCNKTSGECPVTEGNPRCSAGYEDTDKTCRTPCSSYRYGPDCEKTCGQCHGGAVCDGVTGECPSGNPRCATGYTELQCTPCDAGKWGSNCLFTCSENCVIPTCNVTTGACEGGCSSGYAGERCNAEQVIDYTAVIISCLAVVVVTAVIITVVVLVVRRRRSGSSEEAATSSRNTGTTQEVPQPEVPNHGCDSCPTTYNNKAAQDDNPYEAVTEKEYDKIGVSRLDTNTKYDSLT